MNPLKNRETKMKNNKQKPIHEIQLGAVKAAIWENTHDNVIRHNVTVARLYSLHRPA